MSGLKEDEIVGLWRLKELDKLPSDSPILDRPLLFPVARVGPKELSSHIITTALRLIPLLRDARERRIYHLPLMLIKNISDNRHISTGEISDRLIRISEHLITKTVIAYCKIFDSLIKKLHELLEQQSNQRTYHDQVLNKFIYFDGKMDIKRLREVLIAPPYNDLTVNYLKEIKDQDAVYHRLLLSMLGYELAEALSPRKTSRLKRVIEGLSLALLYAHKQLSYLEFYGEANNDYLTIYIKFHEGGGHEVSSLRMGPEALQLLLQGIRYRVEYSSVRKTLSKTLSRLSALLHILKELSKVSDSYHNQLRDITLNYLIDFIIWDSIFYELEKPDSLLAETEREIQLLHLFINTFIDRPSKFYYTRYVKDRVGWRTYFFLLPTYVQAYIASTVAGFEWDHNKVFTILDSCETCTNFASIISKFLRIDLKDMKTRMERRFKLINLYKTDIMLYVAHLGLSYEMERREEKETDGEIREEVTAAIDSFIEKWVVEHIDAYRKGVLEIDKAVRLAEAEFIYHMRELNIEPTASELKMLMNKLTLVMRVLILTDPELKRRFQGPLS